MRGKKIFIVGIMILLGVSFAVAVFSITSSRVNINRIAASRPIAYEQVTATGEGKIASRDFALAGLLPFFKTDF